MNNRSSADQDYKLWWLLGQTRHAVFQARAKELSKHGISGRQAAALFAIQAIGQGATPAEVSRWVSREPHSVSALLTRMERDGLVTKVSDLHRKNLIRLALTEKGQEAYRQSAKRGTIHRILSVLSEEERYQLWSSLERLRDKALEELGTDRKPPFP